MVNVYVDPPKDEAPKTLVDADAGNKVGRENRRKVGLSGYGGRSEEYLDAVNAENAAREEQAKQERLRQEQIQRSSVIISGRAASGLSEEQSERTYLETLQTRPGYYDPSVLGDIETQRRLNTLPAGTDRYSAVGNILEQQRKAAELTPGTRDDQFFLNELTKWNRTAIETSSEYHAETKATGERQKANPYENWGDVALAIEKGGNPKDFTIDRYGFNPNVGGAIGVLPGGQGLQETAWTAAKSRQPTGVDFQPAIDYSNRQRNIRGPYGNLYGGIPDPITPTPILNANRTAMATPISAFGEANAKRPFTSVNAPGKVPTGTDWNPFVVSAAEPIGYISDTPPTKKNAFDGTAVTPYGNKLPDNGETNMPLIPNEYSRSEEWLSGIPVFGGLLTSIPYAQDYQVANFPTSKVKDVPFFGNIAKDAATPLTTEYEYGTPFTRDINTYQSGGPAYTRTFMTDQGKSDTWTYPVGLPELSSPVPVGLPKITTNYNALTGETETITEQTMEQQSIQNYESVTLPKTETVVPITATTTAGTSNFKLFERGFVDSTYGRILPEHINLTRKGETIPIDMPYGIGAAAAVGDAAYGYVRNNPFDVAGMYVAGAGVSKVLGGTKYLVAGSATSKIPVISQLGRAASTPLASDVYTMGGVGLGLFIVGSTVKNIADQPTLERKAEVTGITGVQFAAFGKGMMDFKVTGEPVNPHAGRTFFSGERKLPISEKVMIKGGDWVNGIFQTRGQRVAIKAVSSEYMGKSASFTKPEITTIEPNLADLTHVGPKNAPAVKAAMVDQPSVLYGSGTIKAQTNPNTPMGRILLEKAGMSKDADVFAEFPARMETKAGKAAIGMDVHTFPEGYPNVGQAANAPVQPGSYLFGNRYRTNPSIDEMTLAGKTEGYAGDVSFEHLNVGFRKYSSAMRDDIADPMNKGYRLGKDLSRGTRTRDYLAEIERGRKPDVKGQSSSYDRMLKQEITYSEMNDPITGQPLNIRTETLEAIRARYENNPKDIPDTFPRETKGVLSPAMAAVSGVSPAIIFANNPNLAAISSQRIHTRRSEPVRSVVSQKKVSPSASYVKTTTGGKSVSSMASDVSRSITVSSKKPSGSVKTPIVSPITSLSKSPGIAPVSVVSKDTKPSRTTTPSKTTVPSISSIISPSRSTTRSPSSTTTSTPSITSKTTITRVPPGLFSLPSGSPGGEFARPRGFYKFKEVSPTWTPAEQGRVLFTGQYGKKPPRMPKGGIITRGSPVKQVQSGIKPIRMMGSAPRRRKGRK